MARGPRIFFQRGTFENDPWKRDALYYMACAHWTARARWIRTVWICSSGLHESASEPQKHLTLKYVTWAGREFYAHIITTWDEIYENMANAYLEE